LEDFVQVAYVLAYQVCLNGYHACAWEMPNRIAETFLK